MAQRVSLTPGEVKGVAVGVISHHRRPLLGRRKAYPFAVLATSTNNESATLPGEVIVTPRLPWWVLLLVLLVLTLCGTLALTDVVPVRNWIEQLFGLLPGREAGIIITPSRDVVIDPSGCLWLEWKAPSTNEVYFQGTRVPNEDRSYECPEAITTYYWTIIGADGSKTSRQVIVTVAKSPGSTEPPQAVERFLVRLTDKGLEPDIAQKWEVSPDDLVWTFRLNTGVSFLNGNVVNARVIVDLMNKNADMFKIIASAAAIDDFTVVIKFTDANADEITKALISSYLYVLP